MASLSTALAESGHLPAENHPRGDVVAAALAKALCDPCQRARYLDRDNRLTSYAFLDVAIWSASAYVITLSPDVLAFDLDHDDDVAKAHSLARKLREDGRPVLIVHSGRPGHMHLWAVVADAASRTHWIERAKARGLNPRRFMRPPGSPHRFGDIPPLPSDALDFLAGIGAERRRDDARPSHDYWLQTLRTGQCWQRRDTSPSNLLWLIAKGAAQSGWSFADYRQALADEDSAGGVGYRRRVAKSGWERADEWLERHVWRKAVAAAGPVPEGGGPDVALRLAEVDAAITAADWGGQTGATDRSVLEALLERARAWGVLSPNMSTREIAEVARVTQPTASRATQRLRISGWLALERRGGPGSVVDTRTGEIMPKSRLGTTWRLQVPRTLRPADIRVDAQDRITYVCTDGGCTEDDAIMRALDDVARRGGIGHNGGRVLVALRANGPMANADIAKTLCNDHVTAGRMGSIRRLMRKLTELQLVGKEGESWVVVNDLGAALTTAAANLDLTGKAASVKQQHEQDRIDYDDRVRYWGTRRGVRGAENHGVANLNQRVSQRRSNVAPRGGDGVQGDVGGQQ